jgi:hypothetical protein
MFLNFHLVVCNNNSNTLSAAM